MERQLLGGITAILISNPTPLLQTLKIKLIINSCSKAAIWPEETLKSVLLLASLLALMMAEILGHNLS